MTTKLHVKAKHISCQFLTWISLLLVASFQLLQIYQIEVGLFAQRDDGRRHVSEKRSPKMVSPESLSQRLSPILSHVVHSRNMPSCQTWPRQHHADPKGLVVTLVLTPDVQSYALDLKTMICNAIPSQLIHLLGPQKWDLLLLIAGDRFHDKLSFEFVQRCLNLTLAEHNATITWENLDGSNITTTEFRWDNRVSIFLSKIHLSLPKYVQKNMTILTRRIEPELCNAPKSYIQGTRWYSNEMLHLKILQDYHWFIKLDIDMFFVRTVEWNLLHDMQTRNSLFGHTASLPDPLGKPCTDNIVAAMKIFTSMNGIQFCDSQNPLLQVDRDFFYSNFIMGRVDFWTQPMVRQLGQFLTEYPKGFFHHRWTDQVFWAQAMGMLVPLEATDYSELRCSVETNCWRAIFNVKIYGDNTFGRCDNGAYFVHQKHARYKWNRTLTYKGDVWKSDTEVHPLSYKDECKERISRKRKEFKAKEAKMNKIV